MREIKLHSGWLAARASAIVETGEELTSSRIPTLDTAEWMEAVVPGTVLTTLLKNKLIPDPFYGLENENIVDIGDSGRDYYTFWFSNSFNLSISKNNQAWLKFTAINYSADVFVNGHKTYLPGGMFFRHSVNLTDWLNEDGLNFVAILIYPPDHPGHIPPQGGQGGDHDIAKDVAAQYVEGWDWMTPIRDRNTGIWDDVTVCVTGPVIILDPHLFTTFHENLTEAFLHASTEVRNSSPNEAQIELKIHVTHEVDDGFCSVEHVHSQVQKIAGGSTHCYTFPQLYFNKPHLWWPNGLGEQPLYKVDISVSVLGVGESDAWSQRVGFRHIETHIDKATGGRKFIVNGKPVFIRGGNWIVSDGLLRLSEKRYRADVGFHADMNMNMIRVWAGALAERTAFYDVCDERGILVWQEFWITGDCNGRGDPPSDSSWPLDHALFLKCARDTVKMLRNHASLALWVGGNEQCPPQDINDVLESELRLRPTVNFGSADLEISDLTCDSDYLDGTRLYVKGSLWSGFAQGNGNFADGPYTIQNPEDFFKDGFYPFAFNPEVGSVGVPVAATIRATMPQEAWKFPVLKQLDGGYMQELPNATWEYHKYIPYSDPGKVKHQIASYGHPNDLDDFCVKAQLVNYVQYRALIESWNSRMWTKYTGVLIWKTQNPWPGLRGNLYDHLLDQTAGFFGVRLAAEPIHIQLNLSTLLVEIVNTTEKLLENISVCVDVWDLEGANPCSNFSGNLSAPPFTTISVLEFLYHTWASAKSVYFVCLKLFDKFGMVISRNFYWLHLPGRDYSLLGDFKAKRVPVQVTIAAEGTGSVVHAAVLVVNPSETGCVAFWLHLSVISKSKNDSHEGQEDHRILPVTYDQNYFSLLPGERTTVNIWFEWHLTGLPNVILKGWNIEEVVLTLQDLI